MTNTNYYLTGEQVFESIMRYPLEDLAIKENFQFLHTNDGILHSRNLTRKIRKYYWTKAVESNISIDETLSLKSANHLYILAYQHPKADFGIEKIIDHSGIISLIEPNCHYKKRIELNEHDIHSYLYNTKDSFEGSIFLYLRNNKIRVQKEYNYLEKEFNITLINKIINASKKPNDNILGNVYRKSLPKDLLEVIINNKVFK